MDTTVTNNIKKEKYFELRDIKKDFYDIFLLPIYIIQQLPSKVNSRILDIGCGHGQMLNALKVKGYNNIFGIDISEESIAHCINLKLDVKKIDDIKNFTVDNEIEKFDFIIMTHVLEHLEKNTVIETLIHIKNNLLINNGQFLLAVPNAQALTGTYWAYEDFTHNNLFTAGSLSYVLRSAGFKNIIFLDIDGLLNSKGIKKQIKKLLLNAFKKITKLVLDITGASYHKPSPIIYTWEIKVIVN